METTIETNAWSFSKDKFLEDIRSVSTAIEAPYSEEMTKRILDAYEKEMNDSVVQWRATSKEGTCLNYRFNPRQRTDLITPAIEAGILDRDHPLIEPIKSWTALYDNAPEQLCDFDSDKGFSKTWIYLGGFRPLDDILGADGVPETVRKHGPRFHNFGLNTVRHVAVDWKKHTVNVYFRVAGSLDHQAAARLTSLAGSDGPDEVILKDMKRYASPEGFTFSVTMSVADGVIHRVGFYALKLPKGELPRSIGPRLQKFFTAAPSYDAEEFTAVAWSFGRSGGTYVKAEKGYCGEVVELLKDWRSSFSDGTTTNSS